MVRKMEKGKSIEVVGIDVGSTGYITVYKKFTVQLEDGETYKAISYNHVGPTTIVINTQEEAKITLFGCNESLRIYLNEILGGVNNVLRVKDFKVHYLIRNRDLSFLNELQG